MAQRAECVAMEPFLDAYVDGEFEDREKAEVEAHLGGCAECAHLAKTKTGFKDVLKRANASSPAPERLREAVRLRLADPHAADSLLTEDEAKSTEKKSYRVGGRGVAVAAALAGAMVWFAAGGLSHPLFRSEKLAHPFLEDSVALHARTLPLDFVASDAHAVQRWLQGRLDFGVRVPVFQQAAALQGVRLSQLRTHQAAAVSYQLPEASRRVTLLIVDDPDQPMAGQVRQVEGRDVWMSHSRGYNVASWRHDEIVYSLISDLDEHDVLELVRTAQNR